MYYNIKSFGSALDSKWILFYKSENALKVKLTVFQQVRKDSWNSMLDCCCQGNYRFNLKFPLPTLFLKCHAWFITIDYV